MKSSLATHIKPGKSEAASIERSMRVQRGRALIRKYSDYPVNVSGPWRSIRAIKTLSSSDLIRPVFMLSRAVWIACRQGVGDCQAGSKQLVVFLKGMHP